MPTPTLKNTISYFIKNKLYNKLQHLLVKHYNYMKESYDNCENCNLDDCVYHHNFFTFTETILRLLLKNSQRIVILEEEYECLNYPIDLYVNFNSNNLYTYLEIL
jgi:hypothetical protein